ncbi:MAG TPA: FliH/SctL family protein [Candidatus Hydrogenedentes bacterium]|nr:FliH/SctL family protein [Candidatus Hydrogenedentota bacterium]HOL78039.1 FliH/SctL family protein [Candidatus Hydrogenedentota bacterium]HPO84602.1 FliH/SctL family protein [Candidatus Hydrogenedentota bacterium]
MAKIIKNTDANFVDFQPYEHAPLDPAQMGEGEADVPMTPEMQAAAMLQEARAQAEQKVREAYEEGFRRGIEAGKKEYLESVQTSVQALRRAVLETESAKAALIQRFEQEILEVSRVIVQRILHREARSDKMAIVKVLRAVLDHLSDKRKLSIHVNPQDVEILRREQTDIFDALVGMEHFEVVPDNNVAQGGCLVETESAFVDAQLDTQLNRILDVLWEIPCEQPPKE